MLQPLDNAGLFLIQTLFDLYIFVIMIRLILQWFHIDHRNPLSQFTLKVTDPVIKPLRGLLPAIGGFDLAIVTVLLIFEIIKLTLIALLSGHGFPNFAGLLIWSFAGLSNQFINIFFFAVLISVVVSWINPHNNSPIMTILHQLTEPLMTPIRRVIPTVGGFDISPIPVLIGLKLLTILMVQPLLQIGLRLSLGSA